MENLTISIIVLAQDLKFGKKEAEMKLLNLYLKIQATVSVVSCLSSMRVG